MDPPSDPPPLPVQQSSVVYISAAAAANSSPAQPPFHSHPPYAEMITAAISALNEPDGSSRRAIAKYIETHYPDLQPTHSNLLTFHLKRLKLNGQLLMVKHSYKLPRSGVHDSIDAISSDPSSAGSKRRPGRPSKPKPDAVPAAVPVFALSVDMNSMPDVVPPSNVADGAVNGTPVRGRGRPPKLDGSKRGPDRPLKNGGDGGGVVRRRGRPKKTATGAGREKGPGRPRGRPRKLVNVMEGVVALPPDAVCVSDVVGGGVAPVAGKRRGRPPKVGGEAKKLRIVANGKPKKFSGKPLGRPKKMDAGSQDSQLFVAYLALKAKVENLQSRVVQTATLIKPYLNSEAASNAVQELEGAAMSVIIPLNMQGQQQQQQQQPGVDYGQPQPLLGQS